MDPRALLAERSRPPLPLLCTRQLNPSPRGRKGAAAQGLRKVDAFRPPNEQTALSDRGEGALSRPDALNYDCVGLMGEIVSFHTHTPLVSAQRRRHARETVVRRGKIRVISVIGGGGLRVLSPPPPAGPCGFCEGCRVASGGGAPDSADTRLLTTPVLGRVALSHLFLLVLLELNKCSFVFLLSVCAGRTDGGDITKLEIIYKYLSSKSPDKEPAKCGGIILSETTRLLLPFC